MITSFKRGHSIVFLNDEWFYRDTGELIKKERPCVRCGKMPTKEGHDACIGKLVNVVSACCGHGVEKKYIKEDLI